MRLLASLLPFALQALATPIGNDGDPPPAWRPSLLQIASMAPPLKVAKVETLPEPVLFRRPGTKRVKVWVGPLTLPAFNAARPRVFGAVDPHGRTLNGILRGFPENITVLSTLTTLMYDNGTEAMVSNGVYNHHVAMADVQRSPVLIIKCPNGKPEPSVEISLFAGVGEDRGRYVFSTTDDTIKGGYYIGKNPKVLGMMEVVNYSNVEKKVFAVTDMEYTEGPIPGGMEVSPEILSVTQCSGTDQVVEAKHGQKIFSIKSRDLVANLDGYAFLGRGHLHDGGLNQTLLINGKSVCDSVAVYGEAGGVLHQGEKTWATLTSMAECMSKPVKVSKGDVINLVSNYDLEKHPPRANADGHGMAEEMGLLIFSFAQKKK